MHYVRTKYKWRRIVLCDGAGCHLKGGTGARDSHCADRVSATFAHPSAHMVAANATAKGKRVDRAKLATKHKRRNEQNRSLKDLETAVQNYVSALCPSNSAI